MKTMTVFAVLIMLLLNALGPRSSVGGPLASFFASILIAWAVGLYFAWSRRCNGLGWLLSMLVAVAGGFAGIALFAMVLDTVFMLTHFQGRLIDSNWSYLASASMALASVLGAWAPLELGNRGMAMMRSKLRS